MFLEVLTCINFKTRRFDERISRTKSERKKVAKHGATYQPGKYAASAIPVQESLEDAEMGSPGPNDALVPQNVEEVNFEMATCPGLRHN